MRRTAKRRHAHLNATHVPDLYALVLPIVLWELKCFTTFLAHTAATADGHIYAFGGTFARAHALVFGTATKAGHYADAIAHNRTVYLLHTENTGALGHGVISLLKRLDKLARSTDGHDITPYGTSRASPQTFFQHHIAAISSAIVAADSLVIRNRAATLKFLATHARV